MSHSPNVAPSSVTALLRLEGAAALLAALAAYQWLGGSWWMFAVLLLVPDLSMTGYLLGGEIGARIYNLAHTYVSPTLLAALGLAIGQPLLAQIAVIWVAHISGDRALGYGLKYPGVFDMTHLGPVGRARAAAGGNAHTS